MSKSTPKTQKRLVRLLEIVSIVRATPEMGPKAIYEQLEIESSAYFKAIGQKEYLLRSNDLPWSRLGMV